MWLIHHHGLALLMKIRRVALHVCCRSADGWGSLYGTGGSCCSSCRWRLGQLWVQKCHGSFISASPPLYWLCICPQRERWPSERQSLVAGGVLVMRKIKHLAIYLIIYRHSGLTVSALDSRLSSPFLSPSWGHCVVFLGKTVHSHSATLHPGV